MTNRSSKYVMLTIDVEDWFQVENLRTWFPPDSWDSHTLRVVDNTRRLLDLFDQFSTIRIKATFFVLGWVAERVPELVREISQRGHEVASHGYGHMMCNQIDPDALELDLKRSKQLLEEIIGSDVKGYRAPNFSINDQALRLVKAAGYQYDSSYNNFSRHGRYGHIQVNGAKKKGVAFQWDSGFKELPISNLNVGSRTFPWGGGGYFRFFPGALFRSGVRNILNRDGAYVFYMHPWEIDPEQPRVPAAKGLSGWRHYLNLHRTHDRLAAFIERSIGCEFVTCSQYIEHLADKTN